MSAERPAYKKRTFYGPLELSPDAPQNGDRYIMTHPEDPKKLVRASGEGTYEDLDDMNMRVFITQKVLDGLSRHGINHVNPTYINETSKSGEPYLITVVDKLQNIQPYSELLKSQNMSDTQVREADLVLEHMIEFAIEAMQENGYIDSEMMRLDQFAYDASQAPGKKMVLVDIEPIGGIKVDMSRDSMEHGYSSILASTVAGLCADAIELSNKSGHAIKSLRTAARAVETLPGNSEETVQAKTILLHALDSRRISQVVDNLASGEALDYEGDDDF